MTTRIGRLLNKLRGGDASAETHILTAILNGHALRSHRDIDGNKHFSLHALDGTREVVSGEVVQQLRKKRLLETNHKFPSATFLLTDAGRISAEKATGNTGSNPLTARRFVQKDN